MAGQPGDTLPSKPLSQVYVDSALCVILRAHLIFRIIGRAWEILF